MTIENPQPDPAAKERRFAELYTKTYCANDTDGDGDCAACARYGEQSLCRVQVAQGGSPTGRMTVINPPMQFESGSMAHVVQTLWERGAI
jgi:hypothetical protein